MGIETIAAISLGTSAATAGMGAIGAGMTGKANSAAAAYRAQVARNNAMLAEANARQSHLVAAHQAQRVGLRGAEQLGQTRAIQGASGLDVNRGSTVATQDSIALINRLDQMSEAWKGEVQATEFRNQQANALASALVADADAENAQTASTFQIANSLIGGAGQFATKWTQFSLQGIQMPRLFGVA